MPGGSRQIYGPTHWLVSKHKLKKLSWPMLTLFSQRFYGLLLKSKCIKTASSPFPDPSENYLVVGTASSL